MIKFIPLAFLSLIIAVCSMFKHFFSDWKSTGSNLALLIFFCKGTKLPLHFEIVYDWKNKNTEKKNKWNLLYFILGLLLITFSQLQIFAFQALATKKSQYQWILLRKWCQKNNLFKYVIYLWHILLKIKKKTTYLYNKLQHSIWTEFLFLQVFLVECVVF